MAGSAAPQATSNGRATTPARIAVSKRPRAARAPVDRVLPGSVLTELRNAAGSSASITPESVAELDDRLGITERYGVSKLRLRNYLQRLSAKGKGTARSDRDPQAPADESDEGWNERVRAHRRRQASVAAILDRTFGQLAGCSPDLWERRAYLMLVGLIYERLATNEDEISTDELVSLAKVLAENRRAATRQRDNNRPKETLVPSEPPTGELPERFADVVRQVYGTNFQTPNTRDESEDHTE